MIPSCVEITKANGDVYTKPIGEPLQLPVGDRITGRSYNCGRELVSLTKELDEAVGPGAGDWIKTFAAPVAKLLGKEKCSKCEARRVVTNGYSKLKAAHGQLRAMAIIKELWELSSQPQGAEAALKKFQEYIQ